MRDVMEWLDTLSTMDVAAFFAAVALVGLALERLANRSRLTHDEQVARQREQVRQIVNRDIERRERVRLSQINHSYEHDHWWN